MDILHTKMGASESDKAAGSGGVIKGVVAFTAAIIVLLIVIKQLNLNPSEVTAGTVGVKFQPLAPPPQQQVPAAATAELEKKVQALQERLNVNAAPSTPAASTAPTEMQATALNIAGEWQAYPYTVQIVQMGEQVGATVRYPNGMPGVVCQGTLSGKSLNLGCTNGLTSTSASGEVVATNRIVMRDYSTGYPQQWVLVR